MRRPGVNAARLAAVTAATALVTAACGIGNGGTTSTTAVEGPTGQPIRVGISLPLTGDFAADGQACEKGYQLWASDINTHGGLLGRPVRLVIRNDNSDPNTTAKDYATLITKDQVNLTLAPFSSLLTAAAEPVLAQYRYALVAGSAGAPIVYEKKYTNIFSTTVPVPDQMRPLVDWVLRLPPGQRPTSAAYAMVDDPFADPPVIKAQGLLQKAGVRTAYSNSQKPFKNTHPAALATDAKQVASSNAQMVLIGSVDVPTVAAFIKEFIKDHYNPKIIIAASGPDQGQAFLNAVGTGNATGIMVPNGWYGGVPNALSHVMVQNYIAKYGGTASDINADVAEAYSAGQALAAAVQHSHGLNQAMIINYLHNNEVQTVVGPAQFNRVGQNTQGVGSIFQWQQNAHFVQVLPADLPGSVPILTTKPGWAG